MLKLDDKKEFLEMKTMTVEIKSLGEDSNIELRKSPRKKQNKRRKQYRIQEKKFSHHIGKFNV